MNAHTNNVQVIKQNGIPVFAVIPYEDYLALLPKDADNDSVPQALSFCLCFHVFFNFIKKHENYLIYLTIIRQDDRVFMF